MIVYPNCKINLGLNVVARRSDGYHNLETVFYPIPLCDELSIEEAETDSLSIAGLQLEGNINDNLVMKALYLLREKCYSIPKIKIELKKNIPSGAGLGGGSSDAAFMMKALNERFQLGMSEGMMEKHVSTLGADCAFFIQNKPVYAEGIGNEFHPIALNLQGWHLVLVKPDDFVSTKEAYSLITPCKPTYNVTEIVQQPVETWKELLTNDFEKSVFPNHTNILKVKKKLYEMGATYSCMSGSGSSVFGLFKSPVALPEEFQGMFTYQCKL